MKLIEMDAQQKTENSIKQENIRLEVEDDDSDELDYPLLQTVIPVHSEEHNKVDTENEEIISDNEDENDNNFDETDAFNNSDEFDQTALKAAYLAVLASDDVDEEDEPLDTSLEEEDDDDEGHFIGLDDVDSYANDNPELQETMVSSTDEVLVEDSDDLMYTVDTCRMQTIIHRKPPLNVSDDSAKVLLSPDEEDEKVENIQKEVSAENTIQGIDLISSKTSHAVSQDPCAEELTLQTVGGILDTNIPNDSKTDINESNTIKNDSNILVSASLSGTESITDSTRDILFNDQNNVNPVTLETTNSEQQLKICADENFGSNKKLSAEGKSSDESHKAELLTVNVNMLTPRSDSSAVGEEKIVIVQENGDQNCHSESPVNLSPAIITTVPETAAPVIYSHAVKQSEVLIKFSPPVEIAAPVIPPICLEPAETVPPVTRLEKIPVSPRGLKQYPDYVLECEERLQVHYVSRFAKECPVGWFKVPNKPDCQIFLDVPITEKVKGKTLCRTISDFIPLPGERIVIEGISGSGKTTFIHKLIYDYGLGLLPGSIRQKLVFLIDASLWVGKCSLKETIEDQILQKFWGIDFDNVYEWMMNNLDDCLFVIDHLSDLVEYAGFDHPVFGMFSEKLFKQSSVIVATATDKPKGIKDLCHRHLCAQRFSIEQMGEYVDLFVSNQENVESFKESLWHEHRIKELYKVPLNLALICTLYLNGEIDIQCIPSSQTELFDKVFAYVLHLMGQDFPGKNSADELFSVYEDIAFMVCKLALCSLKDRKFSFSKDDLWKGFDINPEVLDLFLDYGILEKITCKDVYFFPYSAFRDFLAAKIIAIQYYHASSSGQLGISSDLEEIKELFDFCWSCQNNNYQCGRLCVFVAGLLRRDCNLFVESLARQYAQTYDLEIKQSFMRLAFACICENIGCKGFAGLIADALSDVTKFNLDFIQPDATGPSLEGIAHVITAGKLTKLDLTKLSIDDSDNIQDVCKAIQDSDCLKSVAVDFTTFEPSNPQRNHPGKMSDYVFLKNFVKSLSSNTSIKDMSIGMDVEIMSMDTVQICSSLFLNVLSELKQLSVNFSLPAFDSYVEDRPALSINNIELFEKINLLVSRLNVFLKNNRSLDKLELNGGFLHKDILPEIKSSIVDHGGIRCLHVASTETSSFYHNEGILALSDILECKMLTQISIDLDGFIGETKKQREKYMKSDFSDLSADYERELMVERLLKSLCRNNNLETVRFSCKSLECSMIDLIADFIELSPSLKRLELHCDLIDDALLLFLGCGILCSLQLESVTVEGHFVAGTSLAMFFQTCCQSLCLKELTIVGKPITEECLEMFYFSLMNVTLFPMQPFQFTISGNVSTQRNLTEIVKRLNEVELPLDILFEVDLNVKKPEVEL